MRRVFLTFTIFAMIASITISVAHACVDTDISQDFSISQQFDDMEDNDLSNKDKSCDIACSECCLHNIVSNHISIDNNSIFSKTLISNKNDRIFSNLAYGLIRPPRF